jgi:hypothetical protein
VCCGGCTASRALAGVARGPALAIVTKIRRPWAGLLARRTARPQPVRARPLGLPALLHQTRSPLIHRSPIRLPLLAAARQSRARADRRLWVGRRARGRRCLRPRDSLGTPVGDVPPRWRWYLFFRRRTRAAEFRRHSPGADSRLPPSPLALVPYSSMARFTLNRPVAERGTLRRGPLLDLGTLVTQCFQVRRGTRGWQQTVRKHRWMLLHGPGGPVSGTPAGSRSSRGQPFPPGSTGKARRPGLGWCSRIAPLAASARPLIRRPGSWLTGPIRR